jgi:hypothetical protein
MRVKSDCRGAGKGFLPRINTDESDTATANGVRIVTATTTTHGFLNHDAVGRYHFAPFPLPYPVHPCSPVAKNQMKYAGWGAIMELNVYIQVYTI